MQSELRNVIGLNTLQSNKLRIAGIVEESIVDGPGIRLTVFTQGCSHNCPGCHNPQTHDYRGGMEMDIEEIVKMVKANPMLDGITLSGGEPFDQAIACANLARRIKELGLSVVVYSGYKYEYLLQKEEYRQLLQVADILIDGRFDISKKDLTLPFRGSSNQRIIDLKKSLSSNRIYIAS
ncbi:MAG: anaerobic ribonucleoside-triphosphate reductase activating protein [Tissierellia bacterium]|nr:anaerobic ribonucleoside-triphosphate reductase activating protein [Tissierellia bacterium]